MAAAATAKQIVVVVGAGPGLGLSLGRKFSEAGHPVALLSRSQERMDALASQLNGQSSSSGRAVGYAVDCQDESSMNTTIEKVHEHFASGQGGEQHRGASIHTGIFNPNGGFAMASFLDTKRSQVEEAFRTQVLGGFLFSQAMLRAISSSPDFASGGDGKSALGNILISGATASIKGSANFAAFASAKFGLRAMAQSLAREVGPKGIHVAHLIIDGIIVTERTDGFLGKDYAPGSRMDADDIAQVYLDTARQPRSVWSFETDLRPSMEKW
ncbi:short chain dehydrogenase reductase family [Moesziomyces aphidis]|uniref:Short chain dehydrogenase reductase family n=1 Tax=Moesziomyces aphidis TaxID=84754 RepID=W3VFI5_MOEAP|nr:short chain dehydrogenase reductase family [Moesziomyces aphidis]